jgi:RNA polymerase sigma-70 factor (ECF subfamily)
VQEHFAAMLRVARRFLKSDDLAWDAVQESLLALWRTRPAPADLRGWLLRAVVHRCLHLHRGRRRRSAIEERAALAVQMSRDSESPADRLDQKIAAVFLAEALARLPAEQRGVFVLRELHGMSYHAIGRMLGIALGTVRSRLFRARRGLRDTLAPGFTAVGPAP